MTRHRVVFSRAAAAQAEIIAGWWTLNRTASPDMFVRELDATVRILETSPHLGTRYVRTPLPGVRRLLIGRSLYHVYWEVDAPTRTVTLTAIWHARRGSGPEL